MTRSIRVFINGTGVSVPEGSCALDAVTAWDEAAAHGVRSGDTLLTDSRGLQSPAEQTVHAGAIFRLVPSRARAAESTDAS